MTITEQILQKAQQAEQQQILPIKITNKDYNIITESCDIIRELEDAGFHVKTFTERFSKTYGMEIS